MLGKKQSANFKRKMVLWRADNKDLLRKGAFNALRVLGKRRITKPERELIELLDKSKIRHESQFLVNNKFLVDEYLPEVNTIIEADGSYWHSLPRIIKKDKAENAYLKKCGYKVIRIPEGEISNFVIAPLLISGKA
jgi:G:T-mismatch repair DNA endonuclease (very short patch repair protein)